MKNENKFSVGDKIIFYDFDMPDNLENGDVGVVTDFDEDRGHLFVYALWEKTGRRQGCKAEYVRKLTKLDKALA